MQSFKFWILGFLAGAIILAAAVAIFSFAKKVEAPSAPIAKENNTWEDRFFDLRDRSEVLISIFDDGFQPANIIVKKGAKVYWKNEGAVEHYPNLSFVPQNILKSGEVISYTFKESGVYYYNCGIHSEFKAKIAVE